MESKYIGSSEQDAARDNELAALRKKVEEEKQRANDWMARVHNADCQAMLAHERVEKAEREVAACDGHGYLRDQISKIQADLDAARKEGEKEASDAYKKGYIRGLTEGAQCERWECHLTTVEGADDPEVGDDAREVVYWLAARIAARGPMRKKEAKRG